jgi:catechol 2,3-dioxygenase-like lactoylglutathione lyase family enzyme
MNPASQITRRHVLRSLPAFAAASRVLAQPNKPVIRVRALNHMTLLVSDPKRSLEFYQGLFGMPVQARQSSDSGLLRIGSGPQYIALAAAGANRKPGIDHFCMTTEGFNAGQLFPILADHGVTKSEAPGPMKAWTRMRGGALEFHLGDPDGIVVQLQDPSYCGGTGSLGNVCFATPEPAPRKGLIAVRDLSHFTLTVSDPARSRAFYQSLFGMRIQAHQGPAAPLLAVGSGPQFLALGGGGASGATPRTPAIDHACMTMEGFNPDKVLKTLADFGVKPRGDARGSAGPLVSYVSTRMEDRGGAKGGTPELYFTDPDGIVMQLQDVSYCGGSGSLGEICP